MIPHLNTLVRHFQVVNDHSNKTTKTSQNNQSDLKDTNFEYEDNEWDDVGKLSTTIDLIDFATHLSSSYVVLGIGSLIIDLDADIEKSSSTSLENNSSLVIPIGSETITSSRSSKNKEKSSDSDSTDKSEC